MKIENIGILLVSNDTNLKKWPINWNSLKKDALLGSKDWKSGSLPAKAEKMKITFESNAALESNQAPQPPDNDFSLTEASLNPEISDDKTMNDKILDSKDLLGSQGDKEKSDLTLAEIIDKMMTSEGRGGILMAYFILRFLKSEIFSLENSRFRISGLWHESGHEKGFLEQDF